MAKKDYEVLYRIRLEDGSLVVPAGEDPDLGPDEAKTISLEEEEARPFLATGAIAPVRVQRAARAASPS